MKTVLVIFFLTVQSSYLDNSEIDATEEHFDTIQFFADDSGSWRVKTYATDQDVRAWTISAPVDEIVQLARENTEKHYGDVLSEGYIIETADGIDGLRRELMERGLSDHLEVSKAGFLFWAPVGSRYRSQSEPQP